MADLLPEKGMISQKFTSFFTETFAGGTGSILGGIFLGETLRAGCDLVAFRDSNDDTNQNSKSKYHYEPSKSRATCNRT